VIPRALGRRICRCYQETFCFVQIAQEWSIGTTGANQTAQIQGKQPSASDNNDLEESACAGYVTLEGCNAKSNLGPHETKPNTEKLVSGVRARLPCSLCLKGRNLISCVNDLFGCRFEKLVGCSCIH